MDDIDDVTKTIQDMDLTLMKFQRDRREHPNCIVVPIWFLEKLFEFFHISDPEILAGNKRFLFRGATPVYGAINTKTIKFY